MLLKLSRTVFIFLLLSVSVFATAQLQGFSIASDMNFMRSFKKDQRFFVLGPTTSFHFHFNATEEGFARFTFYIPGKFENKLTAAAKALSTTPQQINYTNEARMRLRHFSVGYKKYLKGGFNIEKGWSLYGVAGLGILFGSVTNTHSTTIDTAMYHLPVLAGEGAFKRLTADLGAGWEQPLAGDFYLYAEGKIAIPTTGYPSQFLFVNDKAPFTAAAAIGLRILF